MRLWHKNLIVILPWQQLLGQWRECCLIAKNISEKGNPNHILVNKIMNYPISHFYTYGMIIHRVMKLRGYKCDFNRFNRYFNSDISTVEFDEMFCGWHNTRYLRQCYYNLEEKHDCGVISNKEWDKINDEVVPKLFW